MTKEEAIQILADLTDSPFLHTWEEQYKALHMAIEALKAEPSGDIISRQWLLDLYEIDTTNFKETAKVPLEVVIQNIKDAPSAVCDDCIWRVCNYNSVDWEKTSADRPTVIRSKTLMPTKDFREWAKRIREVNPNAVVIPCDAEVVCLKREDGEDYEFLQYD